MKTINVTITVIIELKAKQQRRGGLQILLFDPQLVLGPFPRKLEVRLGCLDFHVRGFNREMKLPKELAVDPLA